MAASSCRWRVVQRRNATPSETHAVDVTFSTHRCLNKEEEFQESVKEAYFRDGDVHFELFPSTTKSIESFCSLLAAEASLRERPIKVLVPADAHYAWTNVLAKYESHPYLKSMYLSMGDDFQVLRETRFRPGDLVVAVYTLANTVSGRATPVEWFQDVLAYCEGEGASTAHFVDAALAGLCVAKDTLDLRADEDVAEILDGAIGLVQSGFKDFGLSSMLFLAVWKSSSASGAPSLSHFSETTQPCWLNRSVRDPHRHAIELASRRCRGGRRKRTVKF